MIVQSRQTIAKHHTPAYSSHVAANSATGFDGPIKLAHKRPRNTKAGAFFVPAVSSYGGRAGGTFVCAGCQLYRPVNPRTTATHIRLTAISGSSKPKVGAPPMNHIPALNPSASHAAAWKARAMAALRADSSLSVRLARYNAAMTRARELEVQGGAV